LHGDTVARRLRFVFLDLVAHDGATDRANDGCGRLSAASSDLVPDHAPGDAADYRSSVDRLALRSAIDLDGRHRAVIDLAFGDRAIFARGRQQQAHQEAAK